MAAIFEADPEGFRAMQLGRPAAHLVRELVQNVFDEAAEACTVTVKHTPARGVQIVVEDDVAGGIRDEKLVFTIWASDKADVPTKRGRMGRGLKELVSVSDRTVVATQGRPAIEFKRQDGEWSRSHTSTIESPKVGTRIEARIGGWKAKDAKDIIEYLRRVRPPQNVRFSVNGENIARKPAVETRTLMLETVIFVNENGERRVSSPRKDAVVELFGEEKSWVYEMGIPIEPIDYPLSVDVGQRVPLREQRDTLTTYYARQLFAVLLNARIDSISDSQLRDSHVLKAAESAWYLDEAVKKRVAHVWTEGKPYAATPQQMSIATGQHVDVVNLRSLPEAIRDIVHGSDNGVNRFGTNVKDVLEARRSELCPEVKGEEVNPQSLRFVQTWEWIAKGIGRPCKVVLRTGNPGAMASFDRKNAELALYVANLGMPAGQYLAGPLKGVQLSTLIHELSHWVALEESHGSKFTSDAEDVGGLVAQWLVENADKALALAAQGAP